MYSSEQGGAMDHAHSSLTIPDPSATTLLKPVLNPPLKWAGGKRWLVPFLTSTWNRHSHRRLVEPFSGGLAVALGFMPDRALLNDINPHLISFYQWLRRGFQVSMPMQNDSDQYYAYRERFNQLIVSGESQSKEAAELFYYLNRTGYNGLCRFNRKEEFNVPFGRYKHITYARNFAAYVLVLRGWDFTVGDFEGIRLAPDDFIYADPPYDVQFTQYAKEGFGWEDQVRLAKWLAAHPGPVVISNQATPRVVRLYEESGFSLEYHDAPRRINSTGDRSPAREVLAKKGLG
jgi:DNA adenine methylase